jgi:hypothetical protein
MHDIGDRLAETIAKIPEFYQELPKKGSRPTKTQGIKLPTKRIKRFLLPSLDT